MVFIDTIPSTEPNVLTSDTTFSNDILFVYSYSKITKFYRRENFTTEEVMDNLDMFQPKFGTFDQF